MPKYRLQNGRLQRTLSVTQLEDRTTPTTNVVDVTGVGAWGYADGNNVAVNHVDVPPTGTGLINPFLRVQRKGSEHGYNTDYRVASGNPGTNLLDVKTDDNFTKAITLGQVREVMLDGEAYREFRLDLGEPGTATSTSGLVNLSRLQFFLSSSPTERIDQGGLDSEDYVWNNTLGNATLVYNLDANGDVDFTLRDLTSGNGALDYKVYIKSSLFGSDTSKYLYLYSAFGSPPPGSDGTFEEWAAEVPASPPPPRPPGRSAAPSGKTWTAATQPPATGRTASAGSPSSWT